MVVFVVFSPFFGNPVPYRKAFTTVSTEVTSEFRLVVVEHDKGKGATNKCLSVDSYFLLSSV